MIASGEQLLESIRSEFPNTSIRQVFPFLRVRVIDEQFSVASDDDREQLLADALDLTVGQLRSISERLFIRYELLASEAEDPNPVLSYGRTWLGGFADEQEQSHQKPTPAPVHFYGFKGGQGRTTLLAFFANELASDGYRVLVVDLDAEAPTLDLVLGVGEVVPEASLVGLRAGLDVTPLAVSAPAGGGGVSLLAFRPSAASFDLDAAALAFEASVHAPGHEKLAVDLRDKIANDFDVVLMDHRTGLGPTVPAWVHAMPGPVLVLDRLDGQSQRARRDVERLWTGLVVPGALVSYVPPGVTIDTFREQRRGDAWPWLEVLAAAMSKNAEEQLGPDDVEDHWIVWPDDNAFRRRVLPQRDEVGGPTRESSLRLREVLGLTMRMRREVTRVLGPSGATDQGLFIVTEALRQLSQLGSPIRFVFGRKGTGKTRLVAELARRHIGEPLVVAEDETLGGLPSQDPDLQDLVNRARGKDNTEGLWWTLLLAALQVNSTAAEHMRQAVRNQGESLASGTQVKSALRSSAASPRVLLVDGLETMSARREHARDVIQGLLRVNSAVENDPVLRSRLSLRIFLRSDIARWGFENFEQQSHGKRVGLSWSTRAIFNFVLSRLPHLQSFRSTFPGVIGAVSEREVEIQQSALREEECLAYFLQMFPAKLGRLNLNTTTFLRTYFSDDPSAEESYYPRVYDTFLASIDRAGTPLSNGRVAQDVILKAHDEASAEFLKQVRQELRYLVPLADRDLDRLIGFLKNEGTPFETESLARRIRNSLKVRKTEIDETLGAMKEIGIFEQHPNLPGHWRVGRLFKSALKMKYRRGSDSAHSL